MQGPSVGFTDQGGGAQPPRPSQPVRRPSNRPAPTGIAGLDIFGSGAAAAPAPISRPGPGRPLLPGAPSVPAGLNVPARPSVPTARPSAPAAPTGATGPTGAPGARPQSLTGQLRGIAPPDVARQAIDELDLLAHELDKLPARLEQGGIADKHVGDLRTATLAYLGLAQRAWHAVAEERLEQSGAEDDYRRQAIDIARQITHLQREARTDDGGVRVPGSRPFLWRQRVRLIRDGLEGWRESLAVPADPRRMGRSLFELRGYFGLAGAPSFELGLFSFLLAGFNVSVILLILSLLLLLVPAVADGQTSLAVTYGVGALLAAVFWMFTLIMTISGQAPLRLLLGASLYAPTRTVRNVRPGSPALGSMLRGWSFIVMLLGALSLIAAPVLAGLWARDTLLGVAPADDALSRIRLAGAVLGAVAGAAGAAGLATLLLLALPLLVVSQLRLSAELRGNPTWIPAARRYALPPVLGVLIFLTGGLLIAVYAITTAAGVADKSNALLSFTGTQVQGAMITWRAVALVVAVILPYLLLVELPYRAGLRRWRQAWLSNLATRRADLESHLRRLSAADPRTGQQNASDENLRAMQYDIVLLQFYRTKIEEAEQVSAGPFSWRRLLALLAVGLLLAIIVDYGGTVLAFMLATTR